MSTKSSKQKASASKADKDEALWADKPKDSKDMEVEEEEEEEEANEPEYEVELILDKKIKKGQILYLVKWKGYSLDETTWEPADNLDNAPLKIRDFENQLLAKNKESAKTTSHEQVSFIAPEAKTSKKNAQSYEESVNTVEEPSKVGGKRGRKKFEEDGTEQEDDKPKKSRGRPKKDSKEEDKSDDNKKGSKVKNNNDDDALDFKIKKLVVKENPSTLSGDTPYKQIVEANNNEEKKTINPVDPLLTLIKPTVVDTNIDLPQDKKQIEKLYEEIFTKANQAPDSNKNGINDFISQLTLPPIIPPNLIQNNTPIFTDTGMNIINKGTKVQDKLQGLSLSKMMQDEKLMESENESVNQSIEKKDLGSEVSTLEESQPITKIKKKGKGELGSLEKGDIPIKVIGIRPVKEHSDLEIMVNWKQRDNGIKPSDSKIMRIDLLKHGFFMPLIEFYESKMKLEGAPQFDPKMLPKN